MKSDRKPRPPKPTRAELKGQQLMRNQRAAALAKRMREAEQQRRQPR